MIVQLRNSFLLLIIGVFVFSSCLGQNQSKQELDLKLDKPNNIQSDHFEITPETAHPKAKKLLKEEFYWSPIEETAPFGSDDGFDAFYGFRDWRQNNRNSSTIVYLKELIDRWGFPPFDWNEMDTKKIEQYISTKTKMEDTVLEKMMPVLLEQNKSMSASSGTQIDEAKLKELFIAISSNMGASYLLGIDNAIIAVGFGQFVLEGKIDEDIKSLTKKAIKRELLPILMDSWDPSDYAKTRKSQLKKMLAVLDKMNN
jgi:uncharacterized protein YfeS